MNDCDEILSYCVERSSPDSGSRACRQRAASIARALIPISTCQQLSSPQSVSCDERRSTLEWLLVEIGHCAPDRGTAIQPPQSLLKTHQIPAGRAVALTVSLVDHRVAKTSG